MMPPVMWSSNPYLREMLGIKETLLAVSVVQHIQEGIGAL
jgi:hypothetical protein